MQFGPATHIDFCDVYPYHCAVTASTRVRLVPEVVLHSSTFLLVICKVLYNSQGMQTWLRSFK